MSVRRNLVIGFAGIAAFIVGGSGLAVLQMIIGSLTNTGQTDLPGKIEPSPEEKSKKEWEATQQKAKAETAQQTTEAKADSQQIQTQANAVNPQSEVQQYAAPTEEAVRAYQPPPAPPAPAIGPGNFDGPAPGRSGYGAQTGPGNM